MATGLTASNFSYFLIFCATMTFSPGPMTVFLMSLGLRNGLRSSIPAQLGASASYLVSILIFAIGLSELLKNDPFVMRAIQIAGVGYILYLAYRQWTSKGVRMEVAGLSSDMRFGQLFIKGMLTGFSNPKTILMFSAVFPQFAGRAGSRAADIAILGLTFLLLQFASGCSYCYFGQRIKHVLDQPRRQRLMQRITAVLLLGVAGMLVNSFAA